MTPLQRRETFSLTDSQLQVVFDRVVETYAPTDEGEIRRDLREAGYFESDVARIMAKWTSFWIQPRGESVECSTCGQPATHLWASMGADGILSSINGQGHFSPSCDNCGGNSFDDGTGSAVIRAPLDFVRTVPVVLKSSERALAAAHACEIRQLLSIMDAYDRDHNQPMEDAPLVNRVADLVEYVEGAEVKLHRLEAAFRETF